MYLNLPSSLISGYLFIHYTAAISITVWLLYNAFEYLYILSSIGKKASRFNKWQPYISHTVDLFTTSF